MGNQNTCCETEESSKKRAIKSREKEKEKFVNQKKRKPTLIGSHYQNDYSFSKEFSQSLGDIITFEDIKFYYHMGPVIGSGKYGTVHMAAPYSNPERVVAVKAIAIEKLQGKLALVHHEVKSLRKVDHPNIVKIHETFADNEYFYIVMEYCTGIELFDHIEQNGNVCEESAAELTKSILGSI